MDAGTPLARSLAATGATESEELSSRHVSSSSSHEYIHVGDYACVHPAAALIPITECPWHAVRSVGLVPRYRTPTLTSNTYNKVCVSLGLLLAEIARGTLNHDSLVSKECRQRSGNSANLYWHNWLSSRYAISNLRSDQKSIENYVFHIYSESSFLFEIFIAMDGGKTIRQFSIQFFKRKKKYRVTLIQFQSRENVFFLSLSENFVHFLMLC